MIRWIRSIWFRLRYKQIGTASGQSFAPSQFIVDQDGKPVPIKTGAPASFTQWKPR